MNLDKVFISKWLRASDVEEMTDENGTAIVTIDHVAMDDVGSEQKPVLYFQGIEPGLVLNKTNATTLGGLIGKETDEWGGKRVGLFTQEVDFQGKQVLSVRVRMKLPKAAPRTLAPTEEEVPLPF